MKQSETTTPVILPVNVTQEIDEWISKYPAEQKQSAVLPALLIVQEMDGGWLSRGHLDATADYLGMPKPAVYEVATFYSMYDLAPVGKHKICVCTNVSCQLAGSDAIMAHLQSRLGIKPGETTPDQLFTLKAVECLAACTGAPMLQLDKQYHVNLTPEKIDELLESCRKAERIQEKTHD